MSVITIGIISIIGLLNTICQLVDIDMYLILACYLLLFISYIGWLLTIVLFVIFDKLFTTCMWFKMGKYLPIYLPNLGKTGNSG